MAAAIAMMEMGINGLVLLLWVVFGHAFTAVGRFCHGSTVVGGFYSWVCCCGWVLSWVCRCGWVLVMGLFGCGFAAIG